MADAGDAGVLVIAEADPLYAMPGLEAALGRTGTVIALSAFLDDTTRRADLVLPIQTDLERFQAVEPDPVRGVPALLIASPTVAPRGEARHPGDVVLALSATAGMDLPWPGFQEAVEAALSDAFTATKAADGSGSGTAALPASLVAGALNARQFVRRTTDAGGLFGSEEMRRAPAAAPPAGGADEAPGLPDPAAQPAPAAPAGVESFTVIPFESLKLGDGRGANRPWLQELPDPLSTVMWGSWAEIATADAGRLGIRTGDIVRLTGTAADIELPAIVLPTVRPGCIGVPVGGGHADYGRYARGRGVNVNALFDPDRRVTGAAAFARGGVRVRVERLRRPRRSERAAIYGRGLRQAEDIPVGWAPHEPGTAHAAQQETDGDRGFVRRLGRPRRAAGPTTREEKA